MSHYRELLKQRQALEEQLQKVLAEEKALAITEIRQKMAEYGIDVKDLVPGRGKRGAGEAKTAKTGVVPAKYQDPVSGSTWSGRGRAPQWIAGKDREAFLIG